MKPVNQSLWKRDEDTRLRFLRLMVKGIAHFDAGSIQQHQNAFALARWTSTWTDGSPQLSSQAKQARIKVFADHQLCALRLAGQLANVLGEKTADDPKIGCFMQKWHETSTRCDVHQIWPIPACQFLWSQILEFRYHFDCGVLFAQQTLCPPKFPFFYDWKRMKQHFHIHFQCSKHF